MKRVFLTTIIVVFLINNSSAQKRDIVLYKQSWDNQKVFFGFFLGINNKGLKISYNTTTPNAFVNATNSSGFEVGIIGDIRLHKNINLRLEPGLSSNTKTLDFTHIDASENIRTREINGTYLRIPLLLKFNTNRLNNLRPYVVGGVSYDFNFSSNQDNPNDNSSGEFRMTKNNFSYEIGAGIDFYLPFFVFSPSIRGVFAINNELVRDNVTPAGSQYTDPISYFGTRGVFIKFAFH